MTNPIYPDKSKTGLAALKPLFTVFFDSEESVDRWEWQEYRGDHEGNYCWRKIDTLTQVIHDIEFSNPEIGLDRVRLVRKDSKLINSSLLREWICGELRFLNHRSSKKDPDPRLVLQKLLSAMHSGDFDYE